MRVLKPIAILKEFFGLLPGQTNMEFLQEVKALSTAERAELVTLAAKELGVEVDAPVAA
jgi:hypothetical protein